MKKLNKFFAILVALAMMATLCVSMAFAEGAVSKNGKVYITKTLNIAPGLTAPEEFTFTFTPVSRDGVAAADTDMPSITAVTTSGIQGTKATDGNIIKNVEVDLSTVSWAHAGTYVYTVAETDAETKGMTYDGTTYTMTIRIKNGDNNTFVVDQVEVTNGTTKVDPTQPEDTNKDDEDDGFKDDGFNFENTYTKVSDETPTGEDENETTDETESKASYVLTKTVDDAYGDKTKQFKFAVSLDDSAANVPTENARTVTYTKVAKDGTKTEVTPANFTLADGEKLIIEGAYVGTTINVTENLSNDDAAAKKYTATVTAKADGADKAVTATGEGVDAKVENALIGEGVNNAAYTNENTKDKTPLTGILMNNAPYIVLAVLVAGGMVAYVVSKRREQE